MVGKDKCNVHVFQNKDCSGSYGSAYSTLEAVPKKISKSTNRWWTDKDLGTNPKKRIWSWFAECDNVIL